MKLFRYALFAIASLELATNNQADAQSCSEKTEKMLNENPQLQTKADAYIDELKKEMRAKCIEDGNNDTTFTDITGCSISIDESSSAFEFGSACVLRKGQIGYYSVDFNCSIFSNETNLTTSYPVMSVSNAQLCSHKECTDWEHFVASLPPTATDPPKLLEPFEAMGYDCSAKASYVSKEKAGPEDDKTCSGATKKLFNEKENLQTRADAYIDEIKQEMRAKCIEDGNDGTSIRDGIDGHMNITGCTIPLDDRSTSATNFWYACVLGKRDRPREHIAKHWWYDVSFYCSSFSNETNLTTSYPDISIKNVPLCSHIDCTSYEQFFHIGETNKLLMEPFEEMGYECIAFPSLARTSNEKEGNKENEKTSGIGKVGAELGMLHVMVMMIDLVLFL